MHVMQAATGTGQLQLQQLLQRSCRQSDACLKAYDYHGHDIVTEEFGEGAWISDPQRPPSDQKAQGKA